MNILLAVDGSDASRAIFDDLRFAGLPKSDVRAEVISVADVYPFLPPECFSRDPTGQQAFNTAVGKAHELAKLALEDAQTESLTGAARLRQLFPRWTVSNYSCGDRPYRAIVKRAEELKSDLIILGSHGRNAIGRAVFGSVAQRVLTHATCSVRISRPKRERNVELPVRLLTGLDESAGARDAVEVVRSRNWPPLTQVVIASSLDVAAQSLLVSPYTSELYSKSVRENEQHLLTGPLAQASEVLRTAGLNVSSIVCEGSPRHLLLHEARERQIDCIFMGAHGMSAVDRFLLGSVSSSVAAHSHCSVEVVRRPRSRASNSLTF